MNWNLGLGLLLSLVTPTVLASPDNGPQRRSEPELGSVRWWRDYDAARAQAKLSGKPLLILFDEVPG